MGMVDNPRYNFKNGIVDSWDRYGFLYKDIQGELTQGMDCFRMTKILQN